MVPEPQSNEIKTRLEAVLHQQRELVDQLRQGQDQFKRLARAVWSVQEQERRKLARELHDGIGQNLTAIANLIGLALERPAPHRDDLEKARALAEMTLQETRALSRFFFFFFLDDLGLEAALRWLTRTMADANGWEVGLQLPVPMPALDSELSTLVFRATQESLTNAAKHARAQRVDVTLRQSGERLQLQVRDNGLGCGVAQALTGGHERGSGLSGLRDRVRAHDGELNVESIPGMGFYVAIDIPMPTEGSTR